MASRCLSALVSIMAVALALAAPVLAVEVPVYSYEDLVGALKLANDNSKACDNEAGCLGQVVVAQLNVDIYLPQALPGMKANAHFVVTGNCPARKGNRCIIDGQNQNKVFSSVTSAVNSGVSCQLEMYGLIFQRAKGGVIANTYCVVIAQKSIFRNNINSVVTSVGFFGGAPPQTFINCGFFANNGTAIRAGNGKLGLALDGGLAFTFRRCIFRYNTGGLGGAVSLGGLGTSIFEDVYFANNVAADGGGAVFADQTNVIFRGVNFTANTAQGATGGGAVLGQCSTYRNASVSFCSSSFVANSAPANQGTSSLLFRTYTFPDPFNRVDVHFCDTAIPGGSEFTKEPHGSVTEGTGSTCAESYC